MKKHICNKCILIPCCEKKCELVLSGVNFRDFNNTGRCPDCGRKRYFFVRKDTQIYFQCISCKGSFTVYKTKGQYFENDNLYFWVVGKIYNYHYTYNRIDFNLKTEKITNSVDLLHLIKSQL